MLRINDLEFYEKVQILIKQAEEDEKDLFKRGEVIRLSDYTDTNLTYSPENDEVENNAKKGEF